ncbi:MAG TPA: N-acetyltransferase [Solirubrobacterales bacterium]
MSLAATPALPLLAAERPQDAPAVERIVARAFGPGRYAKAAERLREGNSPMLDLSFVAWVEREPVGCVRLWPVEVGGTPALLLGPIAVDADRRSAGLGASLVECACTAAARAGHALVILVGDEPFFGPLGFSAKAAAKVLMPGPVDQRRVLVRALRPSADEGLEGLVTA